jgi:hypothetical protein
MKKNEKNLFLLIIGNLLKSNLSKLMVDHRRKCEKTQVFF